MDVREFMEEWNRSHLSSPSYQDVIDWANSKMGDNDREAPGYDGSQDPSEGWVNIYKGTFNGKIYRTKEEAEKHCEKGDDYITVKIKWKE